MMTAQTPLDVLKAARALIADPRKWTAGILAKGPSGEGLRGDHPDAVCWCSQGAIEATKGKLPARVAAFRELERTVTEGDDYAYPNTPGGLNAVAWVNDALGREAALGMFDRTIARLESEAA